MSVGGHGGHAGFLHIKYRPSRLGNDPNLENISAFQIVMADDAERFSVPSSAASSFPRFEGHLPMDLEEGGGSSREKRNAGAAEGDQGECRPDG